MASTMSPPGAPLTGRRVLMIGLLFFGTVAAANAFLVTSALRTWSGLDEKSPYHAGQVYNAEIRLARAQAERGWHFAAEVARAGAGVAVTARLSDRAEAPLPGLRVEARLERPTDKRQDVVLPLSEARPGTYAGRAEAVPPGQWDLVVDAADATGRVFRRRSRLVLD
ncbi:FixH family protein [Methylobacterium sp. 4-46]|nr:FixH family protein [Methylobacterium sp. 4-46]